MGKYNEEQIIIPRVEGNGTELQWEIVYDTETNRVRLLEAAKGDTPEQCEEFNKRIEVDGYMFDDFVELANDMVLAAARFREVAQRLMMKKPQALRLIKPTQEFEEVQPQDV